MGQTRVLSLITLRKCPVDECGTLLGVRDTDPRERTSSLRPLGVVGLTGLLYPINADVPSIV